ncbi:unnamed protein product [Paramecium pentaurelia]|uniref:Uncharacterized protein n=1 Tax=Paramecium pentaurelia TaxID=43138 RepID=A0A8S1YQZ8_9CILI|nr:unnamed protein product [Paramecium pentaurelia]
MKLGLIQMVMKQEIPILELVIIQLYVDSSFKINFSNQQTQEIQLLTYSQFKNSLDFDIQIIDNEIKLYQKNKLSNTYIKTSFDLFGVQLNKHMIKKLNNMVEYKMIKLNSDSYLIVWAAIESFQYEIFFQIQQQDGIALTNAEQILSGSEIYKLDLQINLLSNSILITWREGSQFSDMSLNSAYKRILLSKESYNLKNSVFQINQENTYTKSLGKVEVVELPNQDIIQQKIFNIMFYNILSETQMINSYKINETGGKVDLTQTRCRYACQECNYQGFYFECTNPDLFILQVDGNCVKKPQNCVNFKSNCLDCIDGYYKTQYLTCEKIYQQIVKNIPLDYQSYYQFFYQVATYSNGNFVVVGFQRGQCY